SHFRVFFTQQFAKHPARRAGRVKGSLVTQDANSQAAALELGDQVISVPREVPIEFAFFVVLARSLPHYASPAIGLPRSAIERISRGTLRVTRSTPTSNSVCITVARRCVGS